MFRTAYISRANAVKEMCPCKGCEKRFAGCHANCEGYTEWKQKVNSKESTEKYNTFNLEQNTNRNQAIKSIRNFIKNTKAIGSLARGKDYIMPNVR